MKYADLKLNDSANGPGVNVSFWVQGCPHRCKGCHNPETWNFEEGKEFTNKTLSCLISGLTANNVYRNLSILGGEPLCLENLSLVDLIVSTVKQKLPKTKIYLWTGYTYEQLLKKEEPLLQKILKDIDLLIDGPFIQEQRDITLPLRGSKNQRIWNLKTKEIVKM